MSSDNTFHCPHQQGHHPTSKLPRGIKVVISYNNRMRISSGGSPAGTHARGDSIQVLEAMYTLLEDPTLKEEDQGHVQDLFPCILHLVSRTTTHEEE